MFRHFSSTPFQALPAACLLSVLAVVVGTGWGTAKKSHKVLRVETPTATMQITPFDLADVSLRDFGDLERQ